MSDQVEKMEAPYGSPGKARASLNAIRLMWGSIEIDGDRVIRTGMYGQRETWVRIKGSGATATYERERED